jgi:hypothetical protein
MDFIHIEVRRDLPFHRARQAAIAAFEARYVAALLRRYSDLEAASRSSGLAEMDLAALLDRWLGPARRRA